MIIIKLEGGLGNQMFQYSLGRNLSLIHNVPFKVDSSYLRRSNQSNRSLAINNFNTALEEATQEEIWSFTSPLQKMLDLTRNRPKRIIETTSTFNPTILLRREGYFCGHWNSEKYFAQNSNIIRRDFSLKKPFSTDSVTAAGKIEASVNSVSVHIRRGDYVSIKKISDIHGILPISYYERAADLVAEKIGNIELFVFSDDIEWAKQNFPKEYPVTFISQSTIPDYEELKLMSLCKNNIIANSTFSWWAAWLNNNPQKIVVSPEHWFTKVNRNENDTIPSTWIKI